MRLVSIILISATFIIIDASYEPCETTDGDSGLCKPIANCEFYNKLLVVKTSENFQYVKNNHCGTLSPPWACCPGTYSEKETKSTLIRLPTSPDCGIFAKDRIHGGNVTGLEEFPWMALIYYKNATFTSPFNCGGSIITEQHILTAAHCVRDDIDIIVRLGEWDTTTNPDCIPSFPQDKCAPAYREIKVEKSFVHENYSSDREHDIALLKLENPIQFNTYIKPICLPLEQGLDVQDNVTAWVAGWGHTENLHFSFKKLKLEVIVKPHEECEQIYGRHNLIVTTNQFCAGGIKGKDTCNGDSGGPLMRQNGLEKPSWYQTGIISYGPTKCGLEGIPGIYTKVSSYFDWIKERIVI